MSPLDHVDDYPEIPVSLGPSGPVLQTGGWRSMRPRLTDRGAPCTGGCPAGVPVPRYFHLLGQGKLAEAYALVSLRNPFPRITGRVCPHPCDHGCNRRTSGAALSIHAVERYLGDATAHLPHPAPGRETGNRVAVIGSGPAGLSAAFYLRRSGHRVTVFEGRDRAGGMLRHGIPPFRLPPGIVDDEVARLEVMGVEFRTATTVGVTVAAEEVRARFDAVFVATGAWREEEVPIPGAGLLHSGLGFLAGGSRRRPGEACVVIGGGNTAVDTARVLHRLGAAVTVVYEGTGRSMPALREGYLRAMKEGITFRFGTRPVAVAPDGEGVTLELEEIATGTRESVACDAAFSAPGELADRRVLDGLLAAGGGAVFAGGDLVSGPATVVEAIAAGRLAAVAIDEHLGARYPEPGWLGGSADDVVGIDEVNAAYLPDRARVREERPANEDPFAEETLTLAVDDALAEIERCLSCGYCNECGTCLVLCPDAAIHWEDGPVIDYDHCKGCGICVFECPGGAMVYVAEREAAHA